MSPHIPRALNIGLVSTNVRMLIGTVTHVGVAWASSPASLILFLSPRMGHVV